MTVLDRPKEILGVDNAQGTRGGLTLRLQTPLLGACLTPQLPLPALNRPQLYLSYTSVIPQLYLSYISVINLSY